ncbi:peptidoglycan-binding domain-containing protein [Labrys sp. 22185]|uniref:peptidoglycan-binding domain-containing protein n=1 Tax=Labrys sp. 22185 TaxID=3453888 RepID=UPI003F85614D
MALQSQLFRGDPKLEAAAISDPAHIAPGAVGDHVKKIQQALILLDGATIVADGHYGPMTAAAVLAYKQKRKIINPAYQTQADNIVGKMTMASLDAEMLKLEAVAPGPVQIKPTSRYSVRPAQSKVAFVQRFDATGGPSEIPFEPVSRLEVPPYGVGTFEVLNAVGGRVMIDSEVASIRDSDGTFAPPIGGLEVRRSPHQFELLGRVEDGTATVLAVASGANLVASLGGTGGHAFLQVKVGAPPPTTTKELNLVGQFDWDTVMSDDDLLQELAGGRWEPGTLDFSAIPGGTVAVTPTFGNMLGAIFIEKPGSISRLNLFTHANKDLIGFGGQIQRRSVGRAEVMINTNGSGDNLTAMDPTSMNNLNQPGVFFEIGSGANKKKVTVADIRTRFAENAMIVLYACHTGQLRSFVKSIATFFNVKVIGFTVDVAYFVPTQTVPHKFVRTGMKLGLKGGSAVPDFRTLITDPKAVTETP